eukprot:CAMPEP_0172692354 /NCGR_PEP_ID=MMETSP1074-20121228/25196_1 /TAXON_ID=2916 /ORGANISM="Ceratium fusus, Strain PA161109" /LENGTH=423 /DNA_ID=CAMNT_0013512545 /DNA_START=13 /DNA_END=1284 /DNA_ORIENTATION=-
MTGLIEVSDEENEHAGVALQSDDAQLAWQLQQHEDLLAAERLTAHKVLQLEGSDLLCTRASCNQEMSLPAAATACSDFELALRLQQEEDEEVAKRSSRSSAIGGIHVGSSSPSYPTSKKPRVGNEVSRSHFMASSTAAPLCSDAVALIRRCIANASDAARSESYLCGPTPFFFQPGGKRVADAAFRDRWSCGYRNVQMLIGHLQLHGWPQLFGGLVPSIETLQVELERLWASGFDPEGRQQLGGVVSGTRKWIGTSEACVLLRGQAVRCNIVAFRSGTTTTTTDPADAMSAASAVVERAWRHFRDSASAAGNGCGTAVASASSRPPLYLQHDGHSRTVVGVQRRSERCGSVTDFLLVLDPGLGQYGFEDFSSCAERGSGWEKFVKRSLAPLRRKAEYELLVVEPDGIITEAQAAAARCIARRV